MRPLVKHLVTGISYIFKETLSEHTCFWVFVEECKELMETLEP